MQKNRELLPISVLKDIGLSVSQWAVDIGTIDAKYSSILEEFVETVCDNMVMLHIESLDSVTFDAILCTTMLLEVSFNDLDEKIPAETLADFTRLWSVSMFTDLWGKTLEEVYNSIEKSLRTDCEDTEPEWWTDAENECCSRQESDNCTHDCDDCDCF